MKFVIKKALTDCKKDLEFCDKFYGSVERRTPTPPRRQRAVLHRLTTISGSEPF